MSGIDFGMSNGAGAAAIAQAFASEIGRKQKESHLKELEERERLAAEFEKLAEDQSLEAADRNQARMHARALRLLMPDKKRPKEYTPDQKLAEQTGDPIGIPAMVPLLYKKVMKEGPKQPPQPAPPPSPSIPPMPGADGGGRGSAGAPPSSISAIPPMPGMPSVPGLPGLPGGDQKGPNAVSPSPAVPAPAAPPAAPAAGALPPMPPGPDAAAEAYGYVPKFRSPEDIAQEAARIKAIENQVSLEPDPETGMVDSRAIGFMKGQQSAALQMRKLGLNPDGTPIPVEQLTAGERSKIESLQARMGLMDAQEAYTRSLQSRDQQKIAIAWEGLNVARQRAAVAEQKALADLMMMGMVMGGEAGGGMGGPQGLLGQPDMAINDPMDAMVEMVLTNQSKLTDWPSKVRPMLALKIAQKGGVVVPAKLQDKLMHFTEAREAVDTIYDSVETYMRSDGVDKAWAGYQMKSKVDGLTRIVGRAMGEKGVFTDRDKGDFQKLLSPGTILQLTAPERAQAWVREVEALMDRVEGQQLQGFYQRVYSKKDGTLDTFKPGDTKNVVREMGGETATPATPATPPPTPLTSSTAPVLPPVSARVAGKTTATINGRLMVWNGKGWKPK